MYGVQTKVQQLFMCRSATQKDTPRGTRRPGNNDTAAKRQALFVFGTCRAIGHGAAAPGELSAVFL